MKKIFTLICVMFFLTNTGSTRESSDFTVGSEETILSAEERTEKGLNYWPDGCMGITKNGEEYSFYGANSNSIAKATGTLDALATTVKYSDKKLVKAKKNFNYASGGPIYENPQNGDLIMLYHAEAHKNNNYKQFYSSLGMAISKDGGITFYDLGEIITSNISSSDSNCPDIVEMGGACYVVRNDYMYVYFRDYLKNGDRNNLCVARASMSDILEAADAGNAPEFKKYYNGAFSQPGIGGLSSNIESKNTNNRWMDITFNTYINKFIMVGSQISFLRIYLYIMFSDDGINWSSRFKIKSDAMEMFYPTIVGLGDNPKETGKEFYIYYTSSSGGWERWNDASVVRRLITLE